MSKKDYRAVALVLRSEYAAGDDAVKTAVLNVARGIADYFQVNNSRFDTDLFLDVVKGVQQP